MQTLLKTLVHVMRFQSLSFTISFTIYGKTVITVIFQAWKTLYAAHVETACEVSLERVIARLYNREQTKIIFR